jgi:hypothetical protein
MIWQIGKKRPIALLIEPVQLAGLIGTNGTDAISCGSPNSEGHSPRVFRSKMASLMPASWNQIATWLRTMDELRLAA